MMYQQLARYYHTIKYLKLKQICYQLYYRLKLPVIHRLERAPKLRVQADSWIGSIAKQEQDPETKQFVFLNRAFAFGKLDPRLRGDDVDFPLFWNHPTAEKLWLYNLHYFDYLNADNVTSNIEFYQRLIQQWVVDNQQAGSVAWEPYPVSLRIINWVKFHLCTQTLNESAQKCLAIQAEFLSHRLEYHLLGNHLFVNAVALIFAGLFFEGDLADKWYRTGVVILTCEIKEQILSDGGHFELSPMYHALILENILDLINLHRCYNKNFNNNWKTVAINMLSWLDNMTHPDGDIAFFNDATFGVAAKFEELNSYARRLHINYIPKAIKSLTMLEQSGYARLKNDDTVLIVDVGNVGPDYIPGHAHADHLSFEMSKRGQRIFVNSGVSSYKISPLRHTQRSTLSHNTAVINNQNSSDVWRGFRVARRAKISNIKHDDFSISAEHDGYNRQGVVHARTWTLSQDKLNVHVLACTTPCQNMDIKPR